MCQNCLKIVVFSWKVEGNNWLKYIDDLTSVFEDSKYGYYCADNLFDIKEDEFIHPKSTDIFHVKTALLCSMEIENPYYQATNTII